MGVDRSIFRQGEKVYLDQGDDDATFLKKGAEPRQTEIVSVDERGMNLADGSFFSTGSGRLEKLAAAYLAEIARERS